MVGIPSYGIAIILITVALKILLYPLTNKQMKSMRAMQQLQPKVKEVQERYKKNPQQAQKAVMQLYKANKVNPLSGCLPLLVQMPILIAFYQALIHLEYRGSSAFLWIPDLSKPDALFILPLLAAASTFWQQKVTSPNATDQTQKMMLYAMPVFIGYISSRFASGLSLYWVIFNVLGALQQMYVNWKGRDTVIVTESVENIEILPEEGEGEKKQAAKPRPVAKKKKGAKRKHAR